MTVPPRLKLDLQFPTTRSPSFNYNRSPSSIYNGILRLVGGTERGRGRGRRGEERREEGRGRKGRRGEEREIVCRE